MKGKMDTDLGQVLISPDVIAQYASETAYECFGIVGMAMVSMKDGLVKLLKRTSSTKGINVEIDEDNARVILKKVEMIFGRQMKLSEISEDQTDLFYLCLLDMRDLLAEQANN